MKPITFFNTLLKTFSQPMYYYELLSSKIWFSIRFCVIAFLILGLGQVIRFNYLLAPKIIDNSNQFYEDLSSKFPKDAELIWNKSSLDIVSTTNQKTIEESVEKANETIVFDYPSFLNEKIEGLPSKMVTIVNSNQDAKTITPSLDQSTSILITHTALYTNTQKNQWRSIQLKDLSGFENEFRVNKDNWPTVINEWKNTTDSVYILLVKLLSIIIPIGFTIKVFAYAIWESLFLFLVFWIIGNKIKFGGILKIVLHICVVSQTITLASSFLYPASTAPISTLSFWAIFIYIWFSLRKKLTKKSS